MEGKNTEQRLKLLNKLKPLHTWRTPLPDDGDYQKHAVEVSIPPVGLGQYVVMVADNPAFSQKGNAVGYLFTHVSNIGFLTRRG